MPAWLIIICCIISFVLGFLCACGAVALLKVGKFVYNEEATDVVTYGFVAYPNFGKDILKRHVVVCDVTKGAIIDKPNTGSSPERKE